MADDADEVKVFRSSEIDELDPQSSDQLAEDKKDVVLEAELESRPQENFVGSKTGAFSKPEPSPSTFANLFPHMPFSPSYAAVNMPWLVMNNYMRNPMGPMSPSMFMPALSPSFMQLQMLCNPASPIYGAMASVKLENSLPNAMRPNPLNQLNQMRMPFGAAPPMNMVNQNQMQDNIGPFKRRETKKKEDHIKKPLNAFMWFMKENRPRIIEEFGFKEKQSAELNKELGKRWHVLDKTEQAKYFEMAKRDREQHKEKYPQWSARENYAVHKRKKRKRDKTDGEYQQDSKKCRARFGLDNQDKWCKFCKRKKRCEYSYASSDGGRMSSDLHDRTGAFSAAGISISASGSSGPSPLTSSMGGPSPVGPSPIDHDGSDSESEVEDVDLMAEDGDLTLTSQALQDVQGSQILSL